ncbi:MAG TPA: flagellar hook capping FlgD N-terminal domain-containing protein [Solirubrobacteraceae bacterium]
MTTIPTAQAAAASSPSTGSASGASPENPNSVLGQNDFLKLMIAQLQAQNPLEPSNGNEYVTELAQFTQLEQTTNLATASELSSAVQLIGHNVTYGDPSTGTTASGKVESVQSGTSGPTLTVEGVPGVKVSSVTEVN